MDETKSPTQTEGSQPPVEGSGGSPDETKSLSETEGSQVLIGDLGESTHSDSSNIGRYRIIRCLGQGGFGRVYLAHDEELDRPVAIKVPNPGRIERPEDVEAYLNEARILARLDHPHIVPVYDVGRTEDGLCFVVSKLIEGCDLAVKLAVQRPSFRDSAELVATIAEALHYAHIKGLVHRDVKPANILIDVSGNPTVADFGLALKDEDFGKGAGYAGTPAYMSPEQARGDGHRVDGRSDIFSLGAMLYELLTGRRPFRGDSHLEVMEQIITIEPRPPRQIVDTIPRELERICLKALSKRTGERYSTAKDMAEDLRRLFREEENEGGHHVVDIEHLLLEPRPKTTRPMVCAAEARVKRIEAKGYLGRLGCWLQLTFVLSIFVTLTNLMLMLQASPRSRPSARPWQLFPTEPSTSGLEMVLYQVFFWVFFLLAVVGFFWLPIRLIVWLFRPVFSVKIPTDAHMPCEKE